MAAGDLRQASLSPRAGRQRRQQSLGVGMSRGVVEVTPFGVLDHLAGVHHRDMVSHAGHDAEVMGDHDHGHGQFGLEALDELDDLRLHGHVERGGGLVGDQELGPSASAMAIMALWRMPPEYW